MYEEEKKTFFFFVYQIEIIDFIFKDDIQKQDLQKINQDIDGKLDRTELEALRDYMDKQLKKLKKLAVSFLV